MDRALGLVREMEEQGIDAPIDIYHTMMDGYTMESNEEKCLVVFERLKVTPIYLYPTIPIDYENVFACARQDVHMLWPFRCNLLCYVLLCYLTSLFDCNTFRTDEHACQC